MQIPNHIFLEHILPKINNPKDKLSIIMSWSTLYKNFMHDNPDFKTINYTHKHKIGQSF